MIIDYNYLHNYFLKFWSNICHLIIDIHDKMSYNGVNSYGMIRAIYRLNIFGSKEVREKMMSRGMGGMGGGPMGRGMGGRRHF